MAPGPIEGAPVGLIESPGRAEEAVQPPMAQLPFAHRSRTAAGPYVARGMNHSL